MSKVTHQLAEGELVNVQIKGARVAEIDHALDGSPIVQLVTSHVLRLPLAMSGVTVERVAPAEWPPQAGDIWADYSNYKWAGLLWDDGVKLYPVERPGATREWPRSVADTVGPMRLLYRYGWTPATDTAPAAPGPEQVNERAEYIAGLRAFADLLESRPDLPLKYPGEVSWLVASKDEVARWAQVLGRSQDSHDGDGAIHHWAKGALAGLSLRAAWIEDLPPAAEPLPHRVPAEVLEISRNIELVEPDTRLSLDEALADAFPGPELVRQDEGSVTSWSVDDGRTRISLELVAALPTLPGSLPRTTDSDGTVWVVTGLFECRRDASLADADRCWRLGEPATCDAFTSGVRDRFLAELGDGWTDGLMRATLTDLLTEVTR